MYFSWCFFGASNYQTGGQHLRKATKDQRISAKIKYEPIPDASFGVTSRPVFDKFFFGWDEDVY